MARPKDFLDVVSRVPGARVTGNKAVAPCPLPGHKTAAGHLSITDGGDKCLVTDQGGRHTYEDICQVLGFDSLTYSPNGAEAKKHKVLVATFPYEHERGKEAYQIRRFDLGNGNKTFEAWHKKDGEYVSGMGEYKNKPILYHLPEIPSWIETANHIYLPEGEQKVECIISKGGAATTSPFGAGRNKWRPEQSKVLAGAEVVILPDNDKPGRDFAQDKAISLHGMAKSVKVLELPELPEKGDIIDWFNAGGTFERLEHLASECPEWKPSSQSSQGVGLVCMADVEAEAVSWLWYPYIPKRKLTLLEGDPGVGKSWVSLAIATAVSLGRGLLGTEAIESAKVLLASAEDGLGDTIRPRLDAMGADVSLIHAIKGALDFGDSGLAMLEVFIEGVRPSLVIVDPLVAYVGANLDIHRANEVRAVMSKLADIAERHSVAILAVRHLTKGGTLKPIYRGLGSIDFAAACRSVLMAGCDPDNPQKRGLVHIKSNLAPMGKAIGYELRDGGFYWTGESDLTWQRILSAEDTDGKSARDEAADFIRDELANGPAEAAKVWTDAKEAGLTEITVKRAKAMLGVITRRQSESGGTKGNGKWTWELPPIETQRYQEYQEVHIEKNDTLNNSSFKNDPLPKTDDTLNTPKAVLGMPIEKAIELRALR